MTGLTARDRLATARLYLCTDSRSATGDLEEFADAVLAGGVDVLQLREKGLEARQELAALEVLADACARHGRLLAVNDRADLAAVAGADVLHVGQDDLAPAVARRFVGAATVIGASTHSPGQTDAAREDPDVDYFCVGPTWTTPTKPGRPAAGLALVEHAAAQGRTKPWFAIGGVDHETLDDVLRAGARRVVVVRAITEADDPGDAARRLAERLAAADGPVP